MDKVIGRRRATILADWMPGSVYKQHQRHPAMKSVMHAESCRPMFEALLECARGEPFASKVTGIRIAVDQALCAQREYVDPISGGMDQRTRRRAAASVRSAVGKLQQKLDEISGVDDGLPLKVDLMLSWLDGSPLQGVDPVQHRFREVLAKLPEAVDAWADSKPAISHNDDNVGPRMLARALRRKFFEWFDSPCDSFTLAVLNIVFYSQTKDWDSSTLRKIAPADELSDWSI